MFRDERLSVQTLRACDFGDTRSVETPACERLTERERTSSVAIFATRRVGFLLDDRLAYHLCAPPDTSRRGAAERAWGRCR